jgi:hypothetical protein
MRFQRRALAYQFQNLHISIKIADAFVQNKITPLVIEKNVGNSVGNGHAARRISSLAFFSG